MPTYTFTAEEAQAAYDEWGCNCGPAALAFALQVPLDAVRTLIPDFEQKRYTSPTMMRAALNAAGCSFDDVKPATNDAMFHEREALVRIQWTGPWTQPGVNPKWAYRQTHWIATVLESIEAPGDLDVVFDINGGMVSFAEWESRIVPHILGSYPRADGGWFPTHIWRMKK